MVEPLSAKLRVSPITLREAGAFVIAHHRTHKKPPRGCKACIAASIGDKVVGVAIIGRPVSRHIQAGGFTCELTRLCTDGTPHAASFLLGRVRRLAQMLGYRELITYTLPEEGGASLRGAGYRCLGTAGGGSWSSRSRPRVDCHPTQEKLKWSAE